MLVSELVSKNLRVVLCTDVSRAMQCHVISSAQRTLELADRFDSRVDDATPMKRGVSMETMGSKNRTKRRFSMLSKAALYKQAQGVLQKKKTPDSKRFGPSTAEVSISKSGDDYIADVVKMANPGQDNLYSCPIIGSMLKHTFHSMWWDINREESNQGICRALLTPTTLISSDLRLISTIPMTLPFSVGLKAGISAGKSKFQIESSFRRKNYLPILSDLENLGIFGSFTSGSEGGLFDLKSNKLAYRRPRSILAKRNSVMAMAEKKGRRQRSVLH